MKRLNSILWGIVLLALGAVLLMNALGVEIDIFFDGWWSLFIIVPCTIGFFTERDKTGNILGIAIGVLLLLCAQGVLKWGDVWKFAGAALVIVLGLRLILGSFFDKKAAEMLRRTKEGGFRTEKISAIFGGVERDLGGVTFMGGEFNAVFGGAQIDLTGATFEGDTVIKVNAVFGGIDVLLPENIRVESNVLPIFGGFSDKRKKRSDKDVYTVYVTGTAIFGGVDVM